MSKEKQYSSEIQVMRENFKFMREIRGWSIVTISDREPACLNVKRCQLAQKIICFNLMRKRLYYYI